MACGIPAQPVSRQLPLFAGCGMQPGQKAAQETVYSRMDEAAIRGAARFKWINFPPPLARRMGAALGRPNARPVLLV